MNAKFAHIRAETWKLNRLTTTEDDKGVVMKARVLVFIGLLCASTMGGPALAMPDFGGTINFHKVGKTVGNRPILAILWNPKRPGEVVPSVATIDARLFGAKPSVKDWFKENSGQDAFQTEGLNPTVRIECFGTHTVVPIVKGGGCVVPSSFNQRILSVEECK
ncbi:MAG: hypothetical protein ACREXS_08710 [Gammaproteobacteria bacterium]